MKPGSSTAAAGTAPCPWWCLDKHDRAPYPARSRLASTRPLLSPRPLAGPVPDHAAKAKEHLDKALEEEPTAWLHVGAAGVHALLDLAHHVKYGLQDITRAIQDTQ